MYFTPKHLPVFMGEIREALLGKYVGLSLDTVGRKEGHLLRKLSTTEVNVKNCALKENYYRIIFFSQPRKRLATTTSFETHVDLKMLQETLTKQSEQIQMKTTPETRNLRTDISISNLAPITSGVKEIPRRLNDNSFYTTFRNNQHALQKMPVTLVAAWHSDDERRLFSISERLQPSPDILRTILKLPNNPHLCSSIRKIVHEKMKNIHVLKLYISLIIPPNEALFYTL